MSYAIDKQFIFRLGGYLKLFKQSAMDVWTFRCPYCGDSQKNQYKTRGYIYGHQGKYGFKCHNCGQTASLNDFIKFIDQSMYKEYLMEKFGHSGVSIKPTKIVEQEQTIHEKIVSKIPGTPIILLDKSHKARLYCENRKIPLRFLKLLTYIEDFSQLSSIFTDYKDRELPEDERILIPFENEAGNIFAIQGRSLIPNAKLRYVTLKMDDSPLVFGKNRIDKSKKIYCVEGPIDSFFLPNAIAVAGSDFGKLNQIISKENAVIVLDNQNRNREIAKKYERIIQNGYSVCIFPSHLKEKDINEMILSGKTSQEIIDLINENAYSGLSAMLKFNSWKKI